MNMFDYATMTMSIQDHINTSDLIISNPDSFTISTASSMLASTNMHIEKLERLSQNIPENLQKELEQDLPILLGTLRKIQELAEQKLKDL